MVIDEQHRFGVRQRALLEEKGHNPDVLVMTATPIPRTLALTVYGDLDTTEIRQLPANRQPVDTRLINPERRDDVYRFVLRRGKQGVEARVAFNRLWDAFGVCLAHARVPRFSGLDLFIWFGEKSFTGRTIG